MIKSMTGFGRKEAALSVFGKIRVELRSTNHKFLEIVLHLPDGFLSIEDRIKKEIEARIKRGRITCAVNIMNGYTPGVLVNKKLLKEYLASLKGIQHQFRIQEAISLDALIHLPGVLSVAQQPSYKRNIWPRIKIPLNQALDALEAMRVKEGCATQVYLRMRAEAIKHTIDTIQARFKKVVRVKSARFKTEEELSSFLKDTDIAEEIERLAFHARNFMHKLSRGGAIGKELDFMAQEMQREANTMGAKSCDTLVSGWVVKVKSQIEKIREQLQNIE